MNGCLVLVQAKPMKAEIRILLLEDSATDAELIRHVLSEGRLSFTLRHVDNKTAFIQQLEESPPASVSSAPTTALP